jgi:hypothetical protein
MEHPIDGSLHPRAAMEQRPGVGGDGGAALRVPSSQDAELQQLVGGGSIRFHRIKAAMAMMMMMMMMGGMISGCGAGMIGCGQLLCAEEIQWRRRRRSDHQQTIIRIHRTQRKQGIIHESMEWRMEEGGKNGARGRRERWIGAKALRVAMEAQEFERDLVCVYAYIYIHGNDDDDGMRIQRKGE